MRLSDAIASADPRCATPPETRTRRRRACAKEVLLRARDRFRGTKAARVGVAPPGRMMASPDPAGDAGRDRLAALLDQAEAEGRDITFWWRDDDAEDATPALNRLLELAGAPRSAARAGGRAEARHGGACRAPSARAPRLRAPAWLAASQLCARGREEGRARRPPPGRYDPRRAVARLRPAARPLSRKIPARAGAAMEPDRRFRPRPAPAGRADRACRPSARCHPTRRIGSTSMSTSSNGSRRGRAGARKPTGRSARRWSAAWRAIASRSAS